MITLMEAYQIAKNRIPEGFHVVYIDDAKDFYCFTDSRVETGPIGYISIGVNKKDGSVFGVSYPRYAEAIRNLKEIPLSAVGLPAPPKAADS